MTERFSTSHLDYLLHSPLYRLSLTSDVPIVFAPYNQRRLLNIRSVGRMEKVLQATPGHQIRMISEDMLIGLAGYKMPVAFLVSGSPAGIAVNVGTWATETASLVRRCDTLKTVLGSLYPAIAFGDADSVLRPLPVAGIALGVPTLKPLDPQDVALPLDRFVRALADANWAYMVLAVPEDEQRCIDLRNQVINEMRVVQDTVSAMKVPSPLAEQYTELLKVLLKSYTAGQSVGMWRTGLYILGDGLSYQRVVSTWRGVFGGAQSLPEPVRVWQNEAVGKLATSWALPEVLGAQGPGIYQRPYEFQTLLSSTQLANYIHLPQLETTGFAINTVPSFDVVPHAVMDDPALSLGSVLHRMETTKSQYRIGMQDLTRHAFVAGVTGVGKTNTIFRLLQQCDHADVPFLIIEPAKAEYRSLLNDPSLAKRLQVFTLGNEVVSPFRLNPFEVLPKVPVGVHLDLLRSVFSVSFGLWTPLPQVLEQCLHAIYVDRGWDITSNTNHRLNDRSDRSASFPTLADLAAKVDVVTAQLGYEERITADVRAALLTRINSLRRGGKGRMLDVRRSLPMEVLFKQPTILELEGLSDDDDKAFMMGLLLIRLFEHWRAVGPSKKLEHLLIIEEAHRLLSNVGMHSNTEQANPRGKAVESFTNMLAEVRAYGLGVIIADQVPVKLAPDVIKNTNLKIAHRIVAADDRQVMASAMGMNERQARDLATLDRGQAAVFSEGDDMPILILVQKVKDDLMEHVPQDPQVANTMRSRSNLQALGPMAGPLPACAVTCAGHDRACAIASNITEDATFQRTFARLIQSTINNTEALDRLWPDLLAMIWTKLPAEMSNLELLRSLATHAADWFAQRRGAQAEWKYSVTEAFATKVRQMMLDKIEDKQLSTARTELQQYTMQLHARRVDPFPVCSSICNQKPAVCLYRHAAADLITTGDYHAAWLPAETEAASNDVTNMLVICARAAHELIEVPGDNWTELQIEASKRSRREAGLCFGQQMLLQHRTKSSTHRKPIMESLMIEAHHE